MKPPNPFSTDRTNPTPPQQTSPLLPVPVLHALASSTAELVSSFILTPAEVLKQNAQMVTKSSKTTSSHQEQCDTDNASKIQITAVPALERKAVTAIAAGLAGSLAAVIATPIDVIKTRIMLSASSPSSLAEASSPPHHQVSPQAQESKKLVMGLVIRRAHLATSRSGRAGGYAVGKEVFRTERA